MRPRARLAMSPFLRISLLTQVRLLQALADVPIAQGMSSLSVYVPRESPLREGKLFMDARHRSN